MSDHPLALSTADRDELAVAALARMKPFERRVLALLYGLPGIADANGELHSVAEICAKTRSSETKIARVAKNALDKLGAVLDLEPVAAGRHLFRLGVHWSAERGARNAAGIEFKPIDFPEEPGWYWRFDSVDLTMERVYSGMTGLMCEGSHESQWHVENLHGWYGPAIPEPRTSNLEPPPAP